MSWREFGSTHGGFHRGYDDGYNSRSQYGIDYDGNMSILTTVLSQILNIVSN